MIRPASPRVDLRIESLRLHGFSELDQSVFLDALRREIARIVEERGAPSGAPLRLDRVRVDCARAAHPADAGRDAARALYAKLRLAGAHGGES